MVSKFTIFINILLASASRILALAAFSSSAWAVPTSLPPLLWSQPIDYITTPQSASDVVYSANWAGAVRNGSEGTFTNVTGTFTVPTLTQPSGSAVAWVGIDGNTCQQAILQTGIYFSIDPDGSTWYDAWYEWFPAQAIFFTAFIINPGDEIRASVAAYNKTSGRAVIENLTTGKTVTKELNSTTPLCLQDVEWIVEDFKQDGSYVPFADFGTFEFTNAVATDSGGKSYTPDGATLIDLKINSSVLTSVAASGDTLTIIHV